MPQIRGFWREACVALSLIDFPVLQQFESANLAGQRTEDRCSCALSKVDIPKRPNAVTTAESDANPPQLSSGFLLPS